MCKYKRERTSPVGSWPVRDCKDTLEKKTLPEGSRGPKVFSCRPSRVPFQEYHHCHTCIKTNYEERRYTLRVNVGNKGNRLWLKTEVEEAKEDEDEDGSLSTSLLKRPSVCYPGFSWRSGGGRHTLIESWQNISFCMTVATHLRIRREWQRWTGFSRLPTMERPHRPGPYKLTLGGRLSYHFVIRTTYKFCSSTLPRVSETQRWSSSSFFAIGSNRHKILRLRPVDFPV